MSEREYLEASFASLKALDTIGRRAAPAPLDVQRLVGLISDRLTPEKDLYAEGWNAALLCVRDDDIPEALRAAPATLDGLLAEIEKGAATADHPSVEDGPAFARGARWAASLIALRDERETHTHTPTSKRGDTNAYCSTCGYFPLALRDERETT